MGIKVARMLAEVGTVAMTITIDRHESWENLVELVQRGANLWPDAPAEIKEFADMVTVGHIQQDYRSQAAPIKRKETEMLASAVTASHSQLQDVYAAFVRSIAKPLATPVEDTLHAAVGASGEAGELLDAVKKTWVYNKPLDIANVQEECGDLCFYIQMLCNQFGWSFNELMTTNMAKLEKRYPSGYSDAAAQARADKNGATAKAAAVPQ